MRMVDDRTMTYYEVIDKGEDNKTFSFQTLKGAVSCVSEWINEFDEDAKNVRIYEREYDKFGCMIRQERVF